MKEATLNKRLAKKHIKQFLKERASKKDHSFSAILIQPYEDVASAVELYLQLAKTNNATIGDLCSIVGYIESRIGNMQHQLSQLHSYIAPPRSSLYFSLYYREPDFTNDSKVLTASLTMALKAIRALYYHLQLYRDYNIRSKLTAMICQDNYSKENYITDYNSYVVRLQKVHFLNLILLEDISWDRMSSFPLEVYYGSNAPVLKIDKFKYARYKDKWYIYFEDTNAVLPEEYLYPIDLIKYPKDLFFKDRLYKVPNKDSVSFFD